MAKNPWFPAVKDYTRRSIPETATPLTHPADVEIASKAVVLANALYGERPAMNRLKETNGAT